MMRVETVPYSSGDFLSRFWKPGEAVSRALICHLPESPPEDRHLDILCLVSNNAVKPHQSGRSFPWEIDERRKLGHHLGLKFEISFSKCGGSLLNLAVFP